jgi:putative hydrolase
MIMVYDFHTHSFFSDGVLSPIELIRRAHVNGYAAIGVTDHASPSNIDMIVGNIVKDCDIAGKYWGIRAIPGVELTHVPAAYIDECAIYAKKMGARLVVVHGETIVEPVETGTNLAAVHSKAVDILAHPGFISEQEAECAAENGIFLEVTARGGHCLTNAHVVNIARRTGARLLVNSDSHDPGDLLTDTFSRKVALGAGVAEDRLDEVLLTNPSLLIKKLF